MKKEEIKESKKSGMKRYGMMKKSDEIAEGKKNKSKMKALKNCCK
jgi:hypothetical protein